MVQADTQFILTSDAFDGEGILFSYDELGFLIGFEIKANLNHVQLGHIYKNLPHHASLLKRLIGDSKTAKLKEVEADLTFENFWNTYAHKIGNKKRAQKLWEKMSKVNKAKALRFISIYESQLARQKGVAKLYPETYINQQRWNN